MSNFYISNIDTWLSFVDGYSVNKNNIEYHQQKIILFKNPVLATFCAENFNINKHLMQNIVLNSNNIEAKLYFCQHVKNADINAFIINLLQNKKYSDSLKLIKKFNLVQKYKNKLLLSNNDEVLYYLLINNINKNKVILKLLKNNNPNYLIKIAKLGYNVNEIEDIILKTNNIKYIKQFSKIKNSKLSVFNCLI